MSKVRTGAKANLPASDDLGRMLYTDSNEAYMGNGAGKNLTQFLMQDQNLKWDKNNRKLNIGNSSSPASTVTVNNGSTVFSGAFLGDGAVSGSYTGSSNGAYTLKIDGVNVPTGAEKIPDYNFATALIDTTHWQVRTVTAAYWTNTPDAGFTWSPAATQGGYLYWNLPSIPFDDHFSGRTYEVDLTLSGLTNANAISISMWGADGSTVYTNVTDNSTSKYQSSTAAGVHKWRVKPVAPATFGVYSIKILNPGTGYDASTTYSIVPVSGSNGSGASCRVTVNGSGQVTGVNYFTAYGSGYTANTQYKLTGGTGNGDAIVYVSPFSGQIFINTNSGYGFTVSGFSVKEVTDTFSWQKDAGTVNGNIAITGGAQAIAEGLSVTFASKVGHTLNSLASIECLTSNPSLIVAQYGGVDKFIVDNNGAISALRLDETAPAKPAVAASYTPDLSTGTVFSYDLGGSTTMNPPTGMGASGKVTSMTLLLTQTTPGTVTWNAAYKFGDAGPPMLSTVAGKTDIVTCFTKDGGTTWFAFLQGLGF